jgi:hypothetical protein
MSMGAIWASVVVARPFASIQKVGEDVTLE